MDTSLSKLQEMVKDRDWRAAVHGVAKSWTWLSDWTTKCVSVNLKLLIYPSPAFTFGNHKFVFYILFFFLVRNMSVMPGGEAAIFQPWRKKVLNSG